MIKNFVKWFGIIALVAIIGFTVVSCGDGGGGTGGGDPRPESPESMSSKTALQYFTDNGIKAGWNLGNTLDAVNAPSAAVETAWGNPAATQALFNGVKQSGFDIVRIPVTWIGHIGPAPDYKVSEARLQRVAQVIGYAKTAGIKAIIINIHHDGNCTQPDKGTWGFVDFKGSVNNPTKKAEVQNQIGKVWTQIANYFKNYGDYLIFETLNEVHNGYNWGFGASNAEQDILFDWNKSALDAIRATGGNNATRYVAVPGLGSTEPDIVVAAHNRNKLLPNDGANGTGKLIVSVHYYAPTPYTVAGVTDMQNPLIHTWSDTATLNHEFELLKTSFFDNGIAVYAGEWGGPTNIRSSMSETIKNTHLDYMGSVAAAARANGVIPILWDDAGNFKCLERSNGKPKAGLWKDVLDKIMSSIASATPPVIGGGDDGDDDDDDDGDGGEVIGGDIVIGAYTWNAFNDEANDGTSSITISETSGTINISGNVTNAFQYGFAGWEAVPDATELAILRTTAASISFKVIGDGKTYKLILPTSDITDYSYYFATFDTTATETTVTIVLNSNLASPGWGQSSQGTAFNQAAVDRIQWQTDDGASGAFSLSIRDLELN